jgi:hypothetical protein
MDAKERIISWLWLRKNSGVVNVAAMQNVSSWFQGWNADLQLNAMCYALAAQKGYSTDGPTLKSIVDNGSPNIGGVVFTGWGRDGGIVDADTIQNLTYYGQLVEAGAQVTFQSLNS